MSTHKTAIDKKLVKSFLKQDFSNEVSDLKTVVGGEGSQAYSFNVGQEEYIIRINRHYNLGFKKDEYAYLNFASKNIPIPKIYKIGKMSNGYYFCISQKAKGVVLNSLRSDDVRKINDNLLDTLEAIHKVNTSNTKGFGKWNIEGQGENDSWQAKILSVDEYVKATPEKPSLFETSFLEKDFWDKIYNRLLELLPNCLEERFLIHGDYGFGNILSDGKKITAVIDWESSMYGDFLFDVAWLSVWSKSIDYEEIYWSHCVAKGIKIDNYRERILCYKLYICLRTFSFFAYSDQEDKYLKLKETVIKYL